MRRLLLGMLALALPLVALGQGKTESAVRKTAEASTLITGTITVGPQGDVREYSIDHAEVLDPAITDFVGASVSAWKFQPVQAGGSAVSVRNRMTIRLVARRQEDKSFSVRINGVNFDPYAPVQAAQAEAGRDVVPHGINLAPPHFPLDAQKSGVNGVVYVVVQVGRDGKVADAVAEQVNLRVVANGFQMEQWRNLLARVAVGAARHWSFSFPTEGDLAGHPYLLIRVPIDFRFVDDKPEYGKWEVYIPGPRQPRPWKDLTDSPDNAPDAQLAGTASLVGAGNGLRLLTPFQGG